MMSQDKAYLLLALFSLFQQSPVQQLEWLLVELV
jgi:hypothetical protein